MLDVIVDTSERFWTDVAVICPGKNHLYANDTFPAMNPIRLLFLCGLVFSLSFLPHISLAMNDFRLVFSVNLYGELEPCGS